MDILDILRRGLEALPGGDFEKGLRAVIRHIEMAVCHLEGGQSEGDPRLFTDAVYRCNQAYEGSIKEIYRVASGKDPAKIKTAKIEEYLEKESGVRQRIIAQLNRYRQEWRNPSTHDYTLDFDENEAFLAIVNIVAFAKLAIGQIGSMLAFKEAQEASETIGAEMEPKGYKRGLPLAQSAAIGTAVWLADPPTTIRSADHPVSENAVASSVAGFLSGSEARDISTELERKISEDPPVYADLFLRSGGQTVVAEFKQASAGLSAFDRALETIGRHLDYSGADAGLVALYSPSAAVDYAVAEGHLDNDKSIHFVLPRNMLDLAIAKRPKLRLDVLPLTFEGDGTVKESMP